MLPNQAVNDGDLDMNSFQHQPYLDNQVRDRGYKLVTVGKSIILPMGIYSDKVKTLADLKKGDRVGLPNDPTNGGRALLLMQHAGLIKLDPKAGLRAGVPDIVENPKGLKFVELDAAQLPRAIPDLAAAAVNTNYAIQAGLVPTRDGLIVEGAESPYACVVVVQDKNKEPMVRPRLPYNTTVRSRILKAHRSLSTRSKRKRPVYFPLFGPFLRPPDRSVPTRSANLRVDPPPQRGGISALGQGSHQIVRSPTTVP